jgi:DHA1 family bicyclomycin/chloramphenicol resistance-like MFS transporter
MPNIDQLITEVSPPAPIRIPNHKLFVLLLGTLSMMAPLSTDMYLPATPSIAASLHAGQAAIVLTLSGFFLGFGAGQLVWGPLSDRFGRRPPMIAAIVVYTAASIGCAYAGTGGTLIAWRFLEGLGGCGAPVIAQAIVRDVYERREGARVMSLMQLVGMIAPVIAPSLGGQIMVWSDWRMIFWILTLFGIVSLGGVALIPETLPPARRPVLSLRALAGGYALLLADRRYVGYALSGGLFGGAFFTYLAGSPLIFIQYYHVPPQWFGPLFSLGILGLVAANILNRALVRHVDPAFVLRWALVAACIDGLAVTIAGLVQASWGGIWLLAPLLLLFVAFQGLVQGNAVVCALAAFPSRAGTAAALSGVTRAGIGALSGIVVGIFVDGTPRPVALMMGAMAVLAIACNVLLLGRVVRT